MKFRCLTYSVFLLLFSFSLIKAQDSVLVRAEDILEQAKKLSRSRKYDSAALMYYKASMQFLNEGNHVEHLRTRTLEADERFRAGRFQESLELLDSIIYVSGDGDESNVTFSALVTKGLQFQRSRQEDSAKVNYTRAKLCYNELGTKESASSLARLLMAEGSMMRSNGNYMEAYNNFRKVENLFSTHGIVNANVGINYYNLAACTHTMGLISETESYLEKQLEVMNQLPISKGDRNIVLNFKSRGDLASSRHSYEEAIELLNYALKVSLESAPRDRFTPEIKEFLSRTYMYKGEPDKALKYLEEALEQNLRFYGPDHPYSIRGYEFIARLHTDQGDHAKATPYYQQASTGFDKLKGGEREFYYYPSRLFEGINLVNAGNNTEKGMAMARKALRDASMSPIASEYKLLSMYGYFADLLFELGNYDSAAVYYQRALAQKSETPIGTELHQNPPVMDFEDLRTLLSLLTNKTKAVYQGAKESQTPMLLKAAYSTILSADTLAQYLRTRPTVFEDKLTYQTRISEINQLGIQIAHDLYEETGKKEYLEAAFYFSEKNKATLVLFNLQENQFLGQSHIPDSITRKVEDYETNIAFLRNELAFKQNDSLAINTIQNEILKNREEKAAFLEYIKATYPGYYQAKFANEFIVMEEIKGSLAQSGQVFLSYQLLDNNLLIFAIDNSETNVYQVALPETFQSDLTDFLRALDEPATSDLSQSDFQSLNARISRLLLPAELEIDAVDDLIIVPDGPLALVPFETLLTNASSINGNVISSDYLIRTHTIAYANSATLFSHQSHAGSVFSRTDILAFAPSYGESEQFEERRGLSLSPLNWTQEEVNSISSYYNVKAVLANEATEDAFRQWSSDYAIIHIAGHGLIDNDLPLSSKLVFSSATSNPLNDGTLSVNELLNMNIPSDMVVLSACNTGAGQHVLGEGVFSLATSFFYAGTKSLVMTLWTANDQSSSFIMNEFYKNLKAGQRKSEALRSAKLAYLQQAEGPLTHPHYWAHFVINGDDSPLEESGIPWYYFLIVTLPLLLLLKQRHRRRSNRLSH